MDLSRNQVLIDKEAQRRIKQAKLLLVGCGLGSLIGTLAVRTGFQKMILADGDVVEENNLNRQAFFTEDIGKNKAEVLRERLLSINPQAEIKAISHFLYEEREIVKLVKSVDFVVNMADPDEALYRIHQIAKRETKVELHPMNVCYTSYCFVSFPDSPSLEEILGERVEGFDFYVRLVKTTAPQIFRFVPSAILERINDFQTGKIPFPQLGLTSWVTASITVGAIVRILKGEKLEENPILITLPL